MKTQNDPLPSVNTDVQVQDFIEDGVSPVEEAMAYDSGPISREERMSNGAVKGAAWLVGIVGVFALAILIAWMCNVNRSPLSSHLASSEIALKSPVKAAKSTLKSLTAVIKSPVSTTKSLVSKISAKPVTSLLPEISVEAKAANSEKVAMSQADNDRIEKEALEVIHGDFGNNPGRAAKLGADYAQVQARVNQLMHI